MLPGVSARATEIFLALSAVAPEARAAALDELCGGDAALRAEVASLLADLERDDEAAGAAGPLDRPVPAARDAWRGAVSMGAQLGEFTLLDVLGTGGAGVVYRALQRRPARTVALKVLRDGLVAGPVRKRFEVEAEILARLHHPGIAQVFAAHPGDDVAPPYIAMELVEGPPITEYAGDRRLPLPDRLELLARVCDAVQHAHQRGVIHRDLKPANILVTADGQPKVLDFGVARAEGGSPVHSTIETEAGQLLGTLAFMSPEQVHASPDGIDTRTDVYALGVVLFRLVTGRLPFGEDDPSLPELARRIVEAPPPRLSAVVPGVAADLETIAARALAKDKDRRYASAADLAADLRRFVAGHPLAASADYAGDGLRPRGRRYRRALAVVAVAAVALAALAGYATVQRARAQTLSATLERELSASNVERGRLLSLTGNHRAAEALVWRELLAAPASTHAKWAAADIYARQPARWSRIVDGLGATSARFSRDGARLLVAGREGRVRLLDAATGDALREFAGHGDQVLRAVFAGREEQFVVSSSLDRTMRVWDAATGTPRHTLADAPAYGAVVELPGGARVAVGSGPEVRLYDVERGAFLSAFTPGRAVVRNVAADAGTRLALVLDDGHAVVWDLERGAAVAAWQAHPVQCAGVAFSPDGARVATSAIDGRVRIWDAATARLLHEFELDGATARAVAFSPDGRRVAAAGWWRAAVWPLEAEAGERQLAVSLGAMDVAFAPDGKGLATVDEVPGRAYLWDVDADPRVASWTAHAARVASLVTLPDARTLVTAGFSGEVRRWDLSRALPGAASAAGGDVAGSTWLAQAARVRSVARSASGAWVAAAGMFDVAVVFDAASGARAAAIPVPSRSAVADFGVDDTLWIGEVDGAVSRAERRAGWTATQRWTSDRGEVLDLLAWPDHLAVAHRRWVVAILDPRDGRVLRELPTDTAPFSLARSPDGQWLAVGTWSGTVDVWDTQRWARAATLRGHARMVGGLDFSPDGRLLASASREGHARVWEVGTWLWLGSTPSRPAGAESVKFLPDSRHLIVGADDGEVAVIDLLHFHRHVDGNEATQRELLAREGAAPTRR